MLVSTKMSLELKIPYVVLPEQSGKYKVVQFMVDGVPYLEFGNLQTENSRDRHTSIVKRFADKIGVEIEIDDSNGIPLYFLSNRDNYKIAGMGWCELNLEEKLAEFYGFSTDYSITIDKSHLETIKQFCPHINIKYNPKRIK